MNMKSKNQWVAIGNIALLSMFLCCLACNKPSGTTTNQHPEHTAFVGQHGQLSVKGTALVDQNGDTLVLRGVSFGWHCWWAKYYNADAVATLKSDWNAEVVRAAIGVEPEGAYLTDPVLAMTCLKNVVDAAIANDLYVIVDWHAHAIHLDAAKRFFTDVATQYKEVPNVIYEIFNEPWDNMPWEEVKAYSIEVIQTIRAIDPDNMILVGSPHWDQDVHVVADDPITGFDHLMYTLHFYAGTHHQELRNRGDYALSKGLPIFVSECAGMEASGDGPINYTEWLAWRQWMADRQLSWTAWSVSSKTETCSMIVADDTPGSVASPLSGWKETDLTEWGNVVRNTLKSFRPLVDANATPETVALYNKMDSLLQTGIMLGHQDDLAYGHGWYNEPGRSDVHSVTGQYPAVAGWEIGRIELDADYNLDSIYFFNMKRYIREAHNRGAINTISWHGNNIVTGGTAWDCAQDTVVKSILPGGINHEKFLTWLDKVAAFLLDLKDNEGRLIPVLFRTYHEHTGSWFWWGSRQCTAEEYNRLWTMTVEYLRDSCHVHNVLYTISPSSVQTKEQYLERYPGDKYVDIIGFDCYANGENEEQHPEKTAAQIERYKINLKTNLDILTAYAAQSGKIPALTETGMERFPYPAYFSDAVYNTVKDYKISYVLFWRNAYDRPAHYYVPYPNSHGVDDFRAFVNKPEILMADDIK
ncbi:MAG: cellulase family glycosylhydrolase [Dysgonamonadaceae bacterium]|jgi:mannan endo-1,4-beta-mannosidase|nr:cellulase family glycosylhydrolase [Dysgonamonadaceae bacterium]